MNSIKNPMLWFSKKVQIPKSVKEILSDHENIPYFMEFVQKLDFHKDLQLWLSIDSIRQVSSAMLDQNQTVTIKKAFINIYQKHFKDSNALPKTLAAEGEQFQKLLSLMKIIEVSPETAEGDEPILEALFEILMNLQKEILKGLEVITPKFLESDEGRQMIEKISKSTPSNSEKRLSNTPPQEDSESNLRIRKQQHKIFNWNGDNALDLLQFKPKNDFIPLNNELADILSTSYGILHFSNFLERNGDSLWSGDGKNLLSFWILIESYTNWNLTEKLSLQVDENVQRIEAAKIYDTFFSKNASHSIKQVPPELLKDMERYISNKVGDDGQPAYFDSFIRTQKDVFEKMVKRFHKPFLESSDYESYMKERLLSMRETVKAATFDNSEKTEDLVERESNEQNSTPTGAEKPISKSRALSIKKVGDVNLTVGFIDELGYFSAAPFEDNDLDQALGIDTDSDSKKGRANNNEESLARGIAKLMLYELNSTSDL